MSDIPLALDRRWARWGARIAALAPERASRVDGGCWSRRQRRLRGDHARARSATRTWRSSSRARRSGGERHAPCARAGCPVVVGTTGWYDAARRGRRRGGAARTARSLYGAELLRRRRRASTRSSPRRRALCGRSGASMRTSSRRITRRRRTRRPARRSRSREPRRRRSGARCRSPACAPDTCPGTHELIFDARVRTDATGARGARPARVRRRCARGRASGCVGRKGVFTMRTSCRPRRARAR